MPGGGGSSRRRDDSNFPAAYAIGDLGIAALRLLDGLDLSSAIVCGPSMASLIGLDLARRAPDRVRGLALWVASYRSDGYARAIAEAVGGILNLDFGMASLRAAAAAFVPLLAGRQMIAAMGRAELEAILDAVCHDWQRNWRPDELASRYAAVAACDLARLHGGEAALAAAVACPTLFLQASSDAIFGSEDVLNLAASMACAEVQVLETPLGHIAPSARPSTPEFAFFDGRTAAFLEQFLT
jgi:pimeloyl-ACP methyl ester carboxylesterase